MPYAYGQSSVHRLPTPLDNTPLDAVSWGKLADAIALGVPEVCASQTEVTEYLAAVAAAGLGPSASSIVRVCRTDKDGIVMRNDGTGWVRETGGSLSVFGFSEASAADAPGSSRVLGAINVDLPCAATLRADADVLVVPPAGQFWGIFVWLEDQTGRVLTTKRRYRNINVSSFYARIGQAVTMPAGAGQIRLFGSVDSGSTGNVQWANLSVAANYA